MSRERHVEARARVAPWRTGRSIGFWGLLLAFNGCGDGNSSGGRTPGGNGDCYVSISAQYHYAMCKCGPQSLSTNSVKVDKCSPETLQTVGLLCSGDDESCECEPWSCGPSGAGCFCGVTSEKGNETACTGEHCCLVGEGTGAFCQCGTKVCPCESQEVASCGYTDVAAVFRATIMGALTGTRCSPGPVQAGDPRAQRTAACPPSGNGGSPNTGGSPGTGGGSGSCPESAYKTCSSGADCACTGTCERLNTTDSTRYCTRTCITDADCANLWQGTGLSCNTQTFTCAP